MTADPLSRLRAGLAEDERIARAACDSARADTDGDAGEWFVDGEDVGSAGVTCGFPQRSIYDTGTGLHGIVCYNEGYPHVEQARHIARQDPKATLDRVEAIRKVIADYERRLPSSDDPALEDAEYRASWMGYRVAGELFLRALASIYPEPTDETENP
ncbi:DUF6221 family protein [Nocardia sp. CY41]|uniref:DUF6221 family protein n=1 Tax=Nocardia sp. CY41 TaxID=2608686 RepID=UPI00135B7BCF|nr:DUF6221 family protein [Nocardia sp. CY41]